MATTAEPTNTSNTDDSNLSGISDAFGGLAEALIDDTDGTESLEADLADTGDAKPETPVVETPVTEPQADFFASAPEEDEPDPLANAKPFDYTVDGTAKPFEGIKVLTDKDGTIQGAIVERDAIARLQDRLQRADFLEAQDKERWQKMRSYESITFKGSDGTEHKGIAAVQQYATENARLSAAVKAMADALGTPEKLIALAYAVQNNDPSEMQRLERDLRAEVRDAMHAAREQWGKSLEQVTQQDTEQQNRTQITTQAIEGSVQQWASQFPSLTKDDLAKAVQHFARVGTSIVRPATPDEAKAAGVKPGDLVIDHPVIHEWLKDRHDLRVQQAAETKKAQDAAKENAQKLAAAARGKSGNGKKPVTPVKPKAAEPEGETWAQQKARLQRGEYAQDDD